MERPAQVVQTPSGISVTVKHPLMIPLISFIFSALCLLISAEIYHELEYMQISCQASQPKATAFTQILRSTTK